MTPYEITFEQARAADACSDGVDRMRRHLGVDWPDDKPFTLATVLDVSGFNDALWGLPVVDEASARLVASDFAARVAHHNPDPRVAAAIRAARGYAHGRVTRLELSAAASAAYSAAISATRHAPDYAATAAYSAADSDPADSAAFAASYAAIAADGAYGRERAWQVAHLRAVLNGDKQPGRVRIRKVGS